MGLCEVEACSVDEWIPGERLLEAIEMWNCTYSHKDSEQYWCYYLHHSPHKRSAEIRVIPAGNRLRPVLLKGGILRSFVPFGDPASAALHNGYDAVGTRG